MVEFWDSHSQDILDRKHVLRQRLSNDVYVKHAKHVLKMIEVALFEEFSESNPHVKIAISMFQKLKPCFISINTIYDTCFFRYRIEFQIHYNTFLESCKKN